VEVRAGRQARMSHFTDLLVDLHVLPGMDQPAAQVAVARDVTVRVTDLDQVALPVIPS
jgi:hypothetical protein